MESEVRKKTCFFFAGRISLQLKFQIHASIAQWIEYSASNRVVTGSSPVRCNLSLECLMLIPVSIFALTQVEYGQAIQNCLGKGEFHAQKVYAEWFRKGKIDLDSEWIEPQALDLVKKILSVTNFSSAEVSSSKEEGDIKKFLLKHADGLESESVIIPMKFGYTLCLSSQVGCKMACSFCETGKMGLLRSLKVEEIVAQVFVAKVVLGVSIRNLVFMGMGEPFDNYEAVMQAIRVISSPAGLSVALSKITVSTSGRVNEILRFAKEADPALKLAVSLNAPNNEIRSKLMPVNKQWDLALLKEAMKTYSEHSKRQILIEYVLIGGVNDSLLAAEEVAEYLKGLPVKINLIPYNAQSKGRFAPPSEETLKAFQMHLKEKGYNAMLRVTRGRSIMAACGQLGNRELRKKAE